jgi:hypothetical protein
VKKWNPPPPHEPLGLWGGFLLLLKQKPQHFKFFVSLRILISSLYWISVIRMESTVLYKYLGAKGGLMMLGRSSLQFTNAMRLNTI